MKSFFNSQNIRKDKKIPSSIYMSKTLCRSGLKFFLLQKQAHIKWSYIICNVVSLIITGLHFTSSTLVQEENLLKIKIPSTAFFNMKVLSI